MVMLRVAVPLRLAMGNPASDSVHAYSGSGDVPFVDELPPNVISHLTDNCQGRFVLTAYSRPLLQAILNFMGLCSTI